MRIIIRLWEQFRDLFLWIFANPINVRISDKTDFFDLWTLVNLSFAKNPFELAENSFYGHRKILHKLGYSSYGSRLEHGVFFAQNEEDLQLMLSSSKRRIYRLKRIFTYSLWRKSYIENYTSKNGIPIEVLPLGPYVTYADHFLSQERLKLLKKQLGRVLLVYPQHSIEQVSHKFNCHELIDKIKRFGCNFDTVLVSLYWADILKGASEAYENAGFTCVCSGKREDPNFMSRQKDIIWLADLVLTNTLGTHIGYSVAMDRQCVMFRQHIEDIVGTSLSDKKTQIESLALAEKRRIADVFFDTFSESYSGITDAQRELVAKYWGVNIPLPNK